MKQLTLLILSGIPASGKSSWARNFIKNNSENWVIVNRDSIRDMLGNYWVPKREDLVTDIENSVIHSAFQRKYNVIVDATNLNSKSIERFKEIVNFYNSSFEMEEENYIIFIKYKEFNVSLKTAIRRDWWRGFLGGRKVGKKVITNFYNKYYGKKR